MAASTLTGRPSLIPDVVKFRRQLPRCTTPACGHVHATFPAPRHLQAQQCTAVDYWSGCLAWWAGACRCTGCSPQPVTGPTRSGCGCHPDQPIGLL